MLPGHNNVHRLDVQQNECQRSYNIHEDMFNIFKKYEEHYLFLFKDILLCYITNFNYMFLKMYLKKDFFGGLGGWMGSLFILTCIKICGHVKTSLLISQRCVEMLRVTLFCTLCDMTS